MRFEEGSRGTRDIRHKMYVLPIFVRNLTHSSLQQAWLLLERNGTHLIEVADEPSAITFAEDNGLLLSEEVAPFVRGGIIYLPVDAKATALTDFYTWVEVAPGTTPPKELWRPFVWSPDQLGLNKYLSEVAIASESPHTVYSVLQEFFTALP